MSFLVKLGIIFTIFIAIMAYDYSSYELEAKKEELSILKDKIYTKPSFRFKSDDYKEFVYVK